MLEKDQPQDLKAWEKSVAKINKRTGQDYAVKTLKAKIANWRSEAQSTGASVMPSHLLSTAFVADPL